MSGNEENEFKSIDNIDDFNTAKGKGKVFTKNDDGSFKPVNDADLAGLNFQPGIYYTENQAASGDSETSGTVDPGASGGPVNPSIVQATNVLNKITTADMQRVFNDLHLDTDTNTSSVTPDNSAKIAELEKKIAELEATIESASADEKVIAKAALEAAQKELADLTAAKGGRRTRRHHKKGGKKSRRQSKKGGKKHRKSAKKGGSKSKKSRRSSRK